MLYISADHRGFELKNKICEYLKSQEIEHVDLGPLEVDPEDDYPDVAMPVIREVIYDHENNKGILICKNGVGVSMFANKFKCIRSALSWSKEHAKSSREDDDTNILSLPAEFVSEKDAFNIVDVWLKTPFSNEERHKRRLRKIEDVERAFKEVC